MTNVLNINVLWFFLFNSFSNRLTDLPADDLSHDCKTIRPIDRSKVKDDPFLNQFKVKKIYVKYNFAYGIPVFGVANFTDDSMLRACYLLR